MANFCSECGSPLTVTAPEDDDHAGEQEVQETVHADVEIARINADRDIKLARITAGLADAERDTDLAHTQGVVDGMHEVLEAAAPQQPEPEPEPEPIIVQDDTTEPDEMAPPETEHHHSEPAKKSSIGMW